MMDKTRKPRSNRRGFHLWALPAPPDDDDRALRMSLDMSFRLSGGLSFLTPYPVKYGVIIAERENNALIRVMDGGLPGRG